MMNIDDAQLKKNEMLAAFSSSAPEARLRGGSRCKVELDGERVRNGLAQLVLTLVKLLHELLERQAIRRMDSGSLTEEEIERLGLTLMRQAEELDRLREVFDLKEEDLNLDLGPLGRLL
ncbi:MAG: gas vesicle protein K [Methylococcaceae bacterium]|nr:gas vesicle protein K [Methylococcaceae bacterium]